MKVDEHNECNDMDSIVANAMANKDQRRKEALEDLKKKKSLQKLLATNEDKESNGIIKTSNEGYMKVDELKECNDKDSTVATRHIEVLQHLKDKRLQQRLLETKHNQAIINDEQSKIHMAHHSNTNQQNNDIEQVGNYKKDGKPNNTDTVTFIQQEYEYVPVTYKLDTDSSDIDSSTGAPHNRYIRSVKKVKKTQSITNNDENEQIKHPKNSNNDNTTQLEPTNSQSNQDKKINKEHHSNNNQQNNDSEQVGNYKKDWREDDISDDEQVGNDKKDWREEDIPDDNESNLIAELEKKIEDLHKKKNVLDQLRTIKYQKGPIDKEKMKSDIYFLYTQMQNNPTANMNQEEKTNFTNGVLRLLLQQKNLNDQLLEMPQVPRIVTIDNTNNCGSDGHEILDLTSPEHKDYQSSMKSTHNQDINEHDKNIENVEDDTNNSKSNDDLKTPSYKKRISNREINGILDVTLNTNSGSKARQLRNKFEDEKSTKRKSKFKCKIMFLKFINLILIYLYHTYINNIFLGGNNDENSISLVGNFLSAKNKKGTY
jgi:hypothetical protein